MTLAQWSDNQSRLDLTSTLDLAVALEALLALAHVLGGEVAALRVVHTLARQLGDAALVNIWNNNALITQNVLFLIMESDDDTPGIIEAALKAILKTEHIMVATGSSQELTLSVFWMKHDSEL